MIKNWILGAILPAVLVVTGLGVLLGLKREEPGKKPPVENTPAALLGQLMSADVEQVRLLTEFSETLDIPVSGTVVPFREIELAAEVAGKIIDKNPNARSGNFVHEGDELYRIDPRDYELEVERLNRKLDQERASLVELQQDVENAKRMLEVADQEMELAEAEVRRFESIQGSFRSQAEVDQAKRSRLASMNQRVSVQNQLSLLAARKSRLELAAKLAETELEQAQLNLDRTIIRAPVDGRVVSEQVEADSFVQRGTPLVVIEDVEKVEVACNLRMDQLYWILDQQNVSADHLVNAAQASRLDLPEAKVTVRFELSGRESLRYEWKGKLDRYDGAGLDPQSRTVPIRVVVEKPGEYSINGRPASESSLSGPASLVRGMFVEVVIHAKPNTQLFLVPKLSVKPATGTNQIWKFLPDGDVLKEVREELTAAGNLANDEIAVRKTEHDKAKSVTNPDDWQAGRVRIIEGVRVIGPFKNKITQTPTSTEAGTPEDEVGDTVEFWVCEVPLASLKSGDAVVVTPLPGIEAEGEEKIRVLKSRLKDR